MAQLDARHRQTLTSETRVRSSQTVTISGGFRVPPVALKGKKKSVRGRGACLPSGRVCFLSVTKPRLPESVKELRDSPPPIHHLRNGIIAISRVRSELQQRSGCRMIPPPLPHPHILNKNLKGGTSKKIKKKVFIVTQTGVNNPISGRCQKFEVKQAELALIIRGILTLLHFAHCWLLCLALYKLWMGIRDA